MSTTSRLGDEVYPEFPKMSESILELSRSGVGNATKDGNAINTAIRGHIKLLSAYWFSHIKSHDPSMNELSAALGISYAAAWRQIRRDSLHLDYKEFGRVTSWLLSLVSPQELMSISHRSLQGVWFGFDYDWPAPPLLDAFHYVASQLGSNSIHAIQMLSDKLKWPVWDCRGAMFADRMKSIRADMGTSIYNDGIKRIASTRNRAFVVEMMNDELSDSELDEMGIYLDMALIMTISCATHIPMDYFCSSDYITPLRERITVNRSGAPVLMCANSSDEMIRLIISFANCSRAAQESILAAAISELLNAN